MNKPVDHDVEDHNKTLAELTGCIDLPDNGTEKSICWFTVFSSIVFVAGIAYYLLASRDDAMKSMVLIGSVSLFVVAFLAFIITAFRGKMCGCKN